MFSHGQGITIPLAALVLYGYHTGFLVMHVVSGVFVQCKRNGSINFVFLHNVRMLMLHGDTAMLFGRQAFTLGSKLCQTTADAETSVAGFDDIVNISVFSCLIWIGKHIGIFLFFFCQERLNILAGLFLFLGFFRTQHCHGTRCAHYCDFCRGPCIVQVSAQLLASHHDVASAVALAQGNGNLGHSGFSIGIQQLCTVQDHSVVLLSCTGQKAGNVHQ